MTHADTNVFLVEVLAGLTVLGFATWMGMLWSSVRRLENELDEHKLEAERRLTAIEEKCKAHHDAGNL